MTILEKNKIINELITKGYTKVAYRISKDVCEYKLIDNKLYCDDMPCGEHANTIEKLLSILCYDARRALYIEEILKSCNVIIDDIESNYDIINSDEVYIAFCKRDNNKFNFIEFANERFYDSGKYIRVVKLDLNTNDLIYDRINLKELKHYHKDSKISKFTLNEINNSWPKDYLTQNHLYDVMAEDALLSKNACAWNSMTEYGDLVGDINIDKLNKNICEVEETSNKEKRRIYYI